MNDNHWGIWTAVIALIVLVRVIGWLVRLVRGGGASQMDRINAAAKRVLDQQAGRSQIPATAKSAAKAAPKPARASSGSQQRQHAQNQPRRAQMVHATAAVIKRRGGSGEPVIQRRR